ncbi:MAG TPA: class I lanthipeptide [Chitinophaga sp.]|uniref:class I lanthipeptide n=1 Tax=Chitinophaga sp. TaxID=1869181 RepID=UPI002C172368|nr:class I lanthipeptide [Chitinophaga sp.]HVI43533.1 class I lanthipeptide [Chitinophaga sp.]
MKKKKLSLSKKLFLQKETVASLTDDVQYRIAGGKTEVLVNSGCGPCDLSRVYPDRCHTLKLCATVLERTCPNGIFLCVEQTKICTIAVNP